LEVFAKVDLLPEENNSVSLTLDRQLFSTFDSRGNDREAERWFFEILAGTSNRDIHVETGKESVWSIYTFYKPVETNEPVIFNIFSMKWSGMLHAAFPKNKETLPQIQACGKIVL
jgi:hypothetical protein